MIFHRFETLLAPYPEALPAPPPRQFLRFLWECTRGLRPLLLAMTLGAAAIGAFEALLFAMMARVVDVLAQVAPAELWLRYGTLLAVLDAVLAASVVLAALYGLLKYQSLFINFPMRLR